MKGPILYLITFLLQCVQADWRTLNAGLARKLAGAIGKKSTESDERIHSCEHDRMLNSSESHTSVGEMLPFCAECRRVRGNANMPSSVPKF